MTASVYHDDLGDALSKEERHSDAEAAYRQAIRLDPNSASYRDSLGDALFRQERYADAEAAYREAIRLDPGRASTISIWRLLFSCRTGTRTQRPSSERQSASTPNRPPTTTT